MRAFRNLNHHLILIISVAVLNVVVYVPPVMGEVAVPWAPNLQAAIQMASRQHQLVLAHFWSPTCVPCKRLEETVFTDPIVAQSIARDYVPVKIDAQAFPDTARQYGVEKLPTDVIIAPTGQLVHRRVSPLDAQQFTSDLTWIAANNRMLNSRSAQIPGPVQSGGPFHQAANTGPSYNPHATAPAYEQNRAAGPSQSASRYTSQFSGRPPVAPPAGAAWAGTADAGIPPGGGVVGNAWPGTAGPNVGWAPPGSGFVQAPPAGNNPPAGVEGFCAVTLCEETRWQRGDPRWGAVHRGRTYTFAGPAQQQRFLANPDLYAPMLSGFDPVQYIDGGQLVQGCREHGVYFRNQVYLFAGEESLRRFWQQPDRYATAVFQAMRQSIGRGRTQ